MHAAAHLPVLRDERATGGDRARRYAVVALVVAALGLWAAAYFQPWWSFTLFAPQYPHGLSLTVSLKGIGGDVHEIDMLNHYIGMGHLEDAAPYERALAGWGLSALGGAVVVLTLLGGRRAGKWLWLPAVLLIGAFLGDSFYWLHRFGHHLNPHAPLHMKPFTPHLFGPGTIGQFHTTAVPALGFELALAALALLAAASFLRARVCARCDLRRACHAVCPRLFVLRRP
jgi:copper chaperone NosL